MMNWRPVFAKQKYLTQTVVELAESLSMELQVCQLETLRDKMTKQNKQNKVKGRLLIFPGQIAD